MNTSIVFFDPQVEQHQALIDELPSGTEWVLLDAATDGLAQIGMHLLGRTGLAAVHVVSHGQPGALCLGSGVLSSATLAAQQHWLRSIGQSLADDGDLLLYGCNVAAGEIGRSFIASMASLTGANVAASGAPTGSSTRGGNARLETCIGAVQTPPLFAQASLDRLEVLLGTLPATLVFNTGGWAQTSPFGDIVIPDSIGSSSEVDLFEFVPNTTGSYTFTIPPGSLDAMFRVYGSNGNPITPIIDDVNANGTESVTLSLTEGQWVQFAVTGFNTSTGAYTVNVNGPDAVAPDLSVAAPTYTGSFQASIGNQGDIDYWHLTAPAGTSSLNVNVAPSGFDSRIMLISTDNVVLRDVNNGGSGVADTFTNFPVTPGVSYYLAVDSTSRFGTGAYTINLDYNPDQTTDFGNPPDSVTPLSGTLLRLDPFGNATRNDSITLGSEFEGKFDLFKFHYEASGPYVISTSGGLDTQLRVYGSNGAPLTPLIDADGVSVANETTTLNLLNDGWIYVAVAGFENNTGSYTLNIDGPSPQFASIATPASAFTGSNSGSISPQGDVDYWQITAPAGTSTLNLSVTPASTLDTVIQLYNNSGVLLQTIDSPSIGFVGDGQTDSETGIPVTAGNSYFVVVSSTGGTFNSNPTQTGNYTLNVDFNPDQLTGFGDPPATITPNTGTVLRLNPFGDVTRSGTVSAAGEFTLPYSLYQFHVESPGNHVISVSGALDAQLRVYDSSGAAITALLDGPGAGGTETTTLNLASTGWVYVAVGGFQTQTGAFSLSVNGPTYDGVSISTAAPSFTGSNSGSIGEPGDVDYWSITAPAGSNSLNLRVAPASNLDTLIELYNSVGALLQTIDSPSIGFRGEGVVDFANGIAVTAGSNYFVGVSSNSRTSTGSYGIDVDFNPDQADTTPPTVTSFFPADEATGVAVGSNIVVTFSETIQRGIGSIVLRDGSGAVVQTFAAATAAQLSLSGSTLTIDPSANLLPGAAYRVDFDNGSVRDLSGNAYAGTTTYNFSTLANLSTTPTPGNDVLTGSNGPDIIDALAGNDIVNAQGGDDIVDGGPGADTLNGGIGNDTAVYPGIRHDYLVSRDSKGVVTVADKFGVMDTLIDFEGLRFSDTTLSTAGLSYLPSFDASPPSSTLVYRFYSVDAKAYFYTTSGAERDNIIAESTDPATSPSVPLWPYFYQGSTFEAGHSSSAGLAPVYRFYNFQTGHHFFTTSAAERENIIKESTDPGYGLPGPVWSYQYEGEALNAYLDPNHPDAVPVTRFYSPTLDRHFFTANPVEIAEVRLTGLWNEEGVAFWGEVPG